MCEIPMEYWSKSPVRWGELIMRHNLDALHQKGWLPGPGEEEAPFLARTEALDHFFSYPPEEVDNFLTDGEDRKSVV